MNDVRNNAIKICLEHILETEYDCYLEYCNDENLNPHNIIDNDHIYACALVALDLKFNY